MSGIRKTASGRVSTGLSAPSIEHSQAQKKFNQSRHLIKSYNISPFMTMTYTGGRIVKSNSEKFFICCADRSANVMDSQTGQLLAELQGDEVVISMALSPDDRKLVMGCRSQNIIMWSMSTKRELRTIKEVFPVLNMDFDPTGTLVAMGCGDGSIKVYDADQHYYTHHFSSAHTGKIQVVKFHPQKGQLLLFTSGLNGMKCWNLETRTCIAHLLDHSSVVTDIAFSEDGNRMMTCSHENIITVYSIHSDHIQKMKTIPVFEPIENMFVIPSDLFPDLNAPASSLLLTAGESGTLRVYNIDKSDCPVTQPKDQIYEKPFTQMIMWKSSHEALCVSADGNFLFYDLKSLKKTKQILGFNDEVLDINIFGKEQQRKMAVATNNQHILLLDMETKNTEILTGHTDLVLALSGSRDSNYLVSGSKDYSVRVWDLKRNICVGIGATHTGSVTSVCFAPKSASFFVSCSDDKTMKLWKMDTLHEFVKRIGKHSSNNKLNEKDLLPLNCAATVIAHGKDISNVSISPDDQLIGTASADRTAKVWSVVDMKMLFEFRHKMGVWSIGFSPVDKCVVTSSSDNVIRIWSLKTGSCIKIFEGHEQAVLRVQFINMGMQLFSASADGLAKLWTIKTGECNETFDVHKDRIWALSVLNDGRQIITGGEDCRINLWTDNTLELQERQRLQLDDSIIKDQQIQNLLKKNKYQEAIILSISMDRPVQVYSLFQRMFESHAQSDVTQVVQHLSYNELISLFQYCVDWNTNSRYSTISQQILSTMFKTLHPNFVSWSYEKSIESLSAYGERHYKRIENLLQKSFLLEFTLGSMKSVPPLQMENMSLKSQTSEDNLTTTKRVVLDPELQQSQNEEQKIVQQKLLQSLERKLAENDSVVDIEDTIEEKQIEQQAMNAVPIITEEEKENGRKADDAVQTPSKKKTKEKEKKEEKKKEKEEKTKGEELENKEKEEKKTEKEKKRTKKEEKKRKGEELEKKKETKKTKRKEESNAAVPASKKAKK